MRGRPGIKKETGKTEPQVNRPSLLPVQKVSFEVFKVGAAMVRVTRASLLADK